MAVEPTVTVVITGMHRSGTSFVASALQAAGLPIGERLLTDFPGNPRGHFEDVDFLAVHEAALAALPEGSFVASDRVLGFAADQRRSADGLVAVRSSLPLWGFKDPRTMLFLEEWQTILPRPRWVFVYRHPLEVLASILRRGINRDVLAVPELGLRVWHAYNERLLAFHAKHREYAVLASIDAVTADVRGFVERVAGKLGVVLDAPRAAGLYQADEMRALRIGPRAERVLARSYPETTALLARLDAAADLPRPPETTASDPADVALAEAAAAVPGAPALACLLAVVVPETWARVPGHLLDSIRNVETEHRKLGAEWLKHKELIENHAAYVQALEAERARLGHEVARLTDELAGRTDELARERAFFPAWLRRLRTR